jgi:hypothetical protein
MGDRKYPELGWRNTAHFLKAMRHHRSNWMLEKIKLTPLPSLPIPILPSSRH